MTSRRDPRLMGGGTLARAGQSTLREHNLSLVFSLISDKGTLSRADIADQTGLTKATVSSLVSLLIEGGLVVEGEPAPVNAPGRPAIPLALAEGTVAAIGLEINVDYIGARAVDIVGNLLGEKIEQINARHRDPAEVFARLMNHAGELVSALELDGVRIVGVALALPGLIDHPRGPLRLAPNLGWREVNIEELVGDAWRDAMGSQADALTLREPHPWRQPGWLVEHLLVDNEANLAARVEVGHHPSPSFIYVSGEVGIGAAIVVDGTVFTGLHGWAGEIGHTVVNPDGPTCACGATGCLEMYAGKRALMEAAGLGEPQDVTALVAAWDEGDTQAREAVDAGGRALGVALANAMNIVDVSQVVLGGDFAPLVPALTEPLLAQLSSRVLASRWVGRDLGVRAASGGTYPAITGAAMAALEHVLSDPASVLDSV